MSASPAFTRSLSWTMMCLPRGIRYSRVSPLSARMTILRMPFTKLPISTRPSISVGANLAVADGGDVFVGDVIAKIVREATRTKDITGGLPRVAELFEARKPKEQAVITEIDGRVEMGSFVKGMRKIVIRADNGETREYLIPRGKHIIVHESDRVKAGEALMDGSPNPHDYLAVLGDRELQRYLVNEVQEVYRLQGVT